MPSVKDINGKEWTFTINVASLSRVKDGLDWDLLSIVTDKESLPRLYGDPIHLTRILFYLCRPENIGIDDWGELWSGDCLDSVYEAVCSGLIDFFPRSRRETVRGLILTYNEMTAAARELVPRELQEAKLKGIAAMSGSSSGNVPESLESTPENSP